MIRLIQGDLSNIKHCSAIISLVNEYRTDPMGGGLRPLTSDCEGLLINGLKDHPAALIILAKSGLEFIGMAVCFWGFSTFQTKKLLNIHDLIVKKSYRNKGFGKLLLQYACEKARLNNCCRLTLEVRSDNSAAMKLYRSVGFKPCDSPMEFWINPL
jgi:ribosomal protein S18 acetylase RimI-like enzyme